MQIDPAVAKANMDLAMPALQRAMGTWEAKVAFQSPAAIKAITDLLAMLQEIADDPKFPVLVKALNDFSETP